MNLFIKPSSQSPAASLYADAVGTIPAQFKSFVVGDTETVNLYLIDGAGGYDAVSGDSGHTVLVMIGQAGEVPTDGTFSLTLGANSTGALPYSISADSLSTALNSLASVSSAGGLSVTGCGELFQITWTTTGTKSDFTGDGSLLIPHGSIEVSTIADGGSGQKIQLIRLMPASLCVQTQFTQIEHGWTGQISTNTLPAWQAVAALPSINRTIQISILDSAGKVFTSLQMPIVIHNRISGSGSSPISVPQLGFSETDPIFGSSEAHLMQSGDYERFMTAYQWGNWQMAGLATRAWSARTFFPFTGGFISGWVAIGNRHEYSAALTVESTTGGLIIPRMTQAQRDAIADPALGLLVFQTNNTPGFYYYTGAAWAPVGVAGGGWPGMAGPGSSVYAAHSDLTVDWATQVTGKQSTYPPGLHTHSALDIDRDTISASRIPYLDANVINSGTFNAARIPSLNYSVPGHHHVVNDIDGLVSDLNGKLGLHATADSAVTITGMVAQSHITNLESDLASKASVSASVGGLVYMASDGILKTSLVYQNAKGVKSQVSIGGSTVDLWCADNLKWYPVGVHIVGGIAQLYLGTPYDP